MGFVELFRSTLLQNLNAWFDNAASLGMGFFWRYFPNDHVAVVACATQGLTVTPIGALRSVRDYLLHFLRLGKKHPLHQLQVQSVVALDHLKRLDAIIEAYEDLKVKGDPSAATAYLYTVFLKIKKLSTAASVIQCVSKMVWISRLPYKDLV